MTELSPEAQAVWDAYELVDCDPYRIDPRKAGLSAALEAAADQVDPKRNIKDISYQHQLYVDGWKDALDKVLTIAAELRGNTTSTETP